jgi:non-ribosomal peptide synthetase component F
MPIWTLLTSFIPLEQQGKAHPDDAFVYREHHSKHTWKKYCMSPHHNEFIITVETDLMGSIREAFALNQESQCNTALLSPPTFDPSILQMMLPYETNGLLLVPSIHSPNPRSLAPLLVKRQFRQTMIMATPAFFAHLHQKDQQDILQGRTEIKDVVLGGEAFPSHLLSIDKWSIRVWNIYGTTECR